MTVAIVMQLRGSGSYGIIFMAALTGISGLTG
jgi:hypothetical protein